MSLIGATEPPQAESEPDEFSPFEFLVPLAHRWRRLICGPLLAGCLALGGSYLLPETYTAELLFVPPQQQQSAATTALASLGALSGLAGAGAMRVPGDQYARLLQTNSVRDQLIDEFKLQEVYKADYRVDALRRLSERVRVSIGKRDGLISLEVDDELPQRAADMANRHIDLLRELTAKLALTEAQQRRVFFEAQLKETKDRLIESQRTLQASGFNAGALRAEPKASAESYARLKAEITAIEARLRGTRQSLTDTAPEVQQQLSVLNSLRGQLAGLEASSIQGNGVDYIGAYRDFKYQEALFELFSRQFEMARMDENREGALIQIVDSARKPEKRSAPKRRQIAMATVLGSFLLLAMWLVIQHMIRRASANPTHAGSLERLRDALGRR